ncbi:hypothetical protein CEXT_593351 [Caerostris extrusa]|uniref:Uncharacterized protein n=1 Tax=Caerostris extrusa TaxID=172846 RepID=A0AAV4TVK1_CAEEX|nr:hypothetical protein CEXT_593351 [Caerostris extrusa]
MMSVDRGDHESNSLLPSRDLLYPSKGDIPKGFMNYIADLCSHETGLMVVSGSNPTYNYFDPLFPLPQRRERHR